MKDIRDLVPESRFTKAGRSVNLVVWRQGDRKTLTVRVAESGTQQASASVDPAPENKGELGLSVAPLDDELRRRFGLNRSAEGVVILEVRPDSPAAGKEFAPRRSGDPGQRQQGDHGGCHEGHIDKARRDGREAVLLRILRREQPIFVAVNIG